MSEAQKHDLTRIVLMVLFIGALIAASLWVLRPFLGAIIWAVMIVVATWPLMRSTERALGGRRWAAAGVMSGVLLLGLIVPLSAAIGTVVANADKIAGWAKVVQDYRLGPPPAWLAGLPLVGEQAANMWKEVAAEGMHVVTDEIAPYAGTVTKWFEIGRASCRERG